MVRLYRKKVFPKVGSVQGKYLFAKKRGGAEYRSGPPPVTKRPKPTYLQQLFMAPYPGMMKRYEAYPENQQPPPSFINEMPELLLSSPTASESSSPVEQPTGSPQPQRSRMIEINYNTVLQNAIRTQGMQAKKGKAFYSTSTQVEPSMVSMSTQATDSQVDELKKELENYHKILKETGVDVEKVISLNESLADLLKESQAESSNRQQVLEKSLTYLETFIDQVVGDTRWRQLLDKDASADQQVQQILSLVSSRDPNLREFVKKVGLFAEKIMEVRDKNIQTEPEGVMGRPKRKEGPSLSLVQQRHRKKRVKTSAATGPPIKVRIAKRKILENKIKK